MFETELAELADAIRKAVTDYKQAGPVPTRRYVRVRRRDFTLTYADDFGFANFKPERVEWEAWESNDQERFETSVLQALPAYKSLISKLESSTGLIDNFARA